MSKIYKELHIYTSIDSDMITRTIRDKEGKILFQTYYSKHVIPPLGPIELLEGALSGEKFNLQEDYTASLAEIAFRLKMLNANNPTERKLFKRVKHLFRWLPK